MQGKSRKHLMLNITFLLFSAPISKVIDYLPKNIPRILINRTIVHPPETIEENDKNHNDDDGDGIQHRRRHDFRKNYVFDAYLLGYCDVVTRALGHDLFSTDTTNTNKGLLDAALLSTVLESDNSYTNPTYRAEDWLSVQVPSDRVFLFEGAQPSQSGTTTSTAGSSNNNSNNNSNADGISFREIAHCDGCTKRIEGTIQKCVVCFDYDLCQKCYPTLSKLHYDGKHHFASEAVLSE